MGVSPATSLKAPLNHMVVGLAYRAFSLSSVIRAHVLQPLVLLRSHFQPLECLPSSKHGKPCDHKYCLRRHVV